MRWLPFALLFSFIRSQAQVDTVTIVGKIINDQQTPLNHVMILNLRTNTGSFASTDGSFKEVMLKTDTLHIRSLGYRSQYLCLKDSAEKATFFVTIKLGDIQYKLKEVNIYPEKTLTQLEKEIKKIGVEETNTYQEVNALESPITFLYERFSKFEQSKRLVAEMENEDRKRAVLKDLFRIYIKYDIIYLSDSQFDEFIDYCALSDAFIKSATQYELIAAIQQKFKGYKFSHPTVE